MKYLENIWKKEIGATEDDVEELRKWLRKCNFPSQYLPKEYIGFLQESNGGLFTNGEREYQFFSTKEIVEMYQVYKFYLYMPYAFPFALDGCGNFYLFDLRRRNENVYAVSGGNMGWGLDECYLIAENFTECLQQKETLDEMMVIPSPYEKPIMVYHTPFGKIEVLVDQVPVSFIVREIPDERWPNLDGRIMIMLSYKPDGREHQLSCVLKEHTSHPNDGIESGERLESIGLYKDDGKISIGIEFEGWWLNGKYCSDYDYKMSYDENGRMSFELGEDTKTNKYIWGIAWIEKNVEDFGTDTWFGADPTMY